MKYPFAALMIASCTIFSTQADTLALNAQAPKSYVVKKGDTLYSISKQYGVTLDNLVRVNQIKDQVIFLNQELKIPIKN